MGTLPHDHRAPIPTQRFGQKAAAALMVLALLPACAKPLSPVVLQAQANVPRGLPAPGCSSSALPFVALLAMPGSPPFGQYAYPPVGTPPTLPVPKLRPPSGLSLNGAVSNPTGGYTNAFSLGADWIRVKEVGTEWRLDDLAGTPTVSDPGWAILFHVVDDQI